MLCFLASVTVNIYFQDQPFLLSHLPSVTLKPPEDRLPFNLCSEKLNEKKKFHCHLLQTVMEY